MLYTLNRLADRFLGGWAVGSPSVCDWTLGEGERERERHWTVTFTCAFADLHIYHIYLQRSEALGEMVKPLILILGKAVWAVRRRRCALCKMQGGPSRNPHRYGVSGKRYLKIQCLIRLNHQVSHWKSFNYHSIINQDAFFGVFFMADILIPIFWPHWKLFQLFQRNDAALRLRDDGHVDQVVDYWCAATGLGRNGGGHGPPLPRLVPFLGLSHGSSTINWIRYTYIFTFLYTIMCIYIYVTCRYTSWNFWETIVVYHTLVATIIFYR